MEAFILAISLLFSQVNAKGVDFNQAILGCLMSDGDCLTHTPIPFVNSFFKAFFGVGSDNSIEMSDDYVCHGYRLGQISYPIKACRELKKNFYKRAKQDIGEWNPPTGQKPNTYHFYEEVDYFEQIENQLTNTKRGDKPYFDCTRNQLYLWLKNQCGHTQAYERKWVDCLSSSREECKAQGWSCKNCD